MTLVWLKADKFGIIYSDDKNNANCSMIIELKLFIWLHLSSVYPHIHDIFCLSNRYNLGGSEQMASMFYFCSHYEQSSTHSSYEACIEVILNTHLISIQTIMEVQ